MNDSNNHNKPIGLFTIVSWMLGIIGIFVLIIVSARVAWKVLYLAPLCSSIGFIFGGIEIKNSTRKIPAIWGTIICFIGLLLELCVWIIAGIQTY